MTWQLVETADGQYAVDWEIVANVIRQYELANTKIQRYSTVNISQSSWYNPFSWSLPNIVNIDIDWKEVRSTTEVQSFSEVIRFRNAAQKQMRREAYALLEKLKRTVSLKDQFVQKMRAVQSQNAQNIDKAVADYQGHIDKAKFVRNTSAGTLMVGATFMSGGAATAVIGAASGLKGVAKYQDTGKVGAAVMEATGNFVFGIIPVKAGAAGMPLTKIEEGCLVILETQWETGIGLAEGKTFSEALGTGALKLTGPAVDKVFGSDAMIKMLSRVPVPLRITLKGDPLAINTLASKQLASMMKAQVDKRGGDFMTQKFGTPPQAAIPPSALAGDQVVRTALNPQEILLKLTIIHMQKGAGHGW